MSEKVKKENQKNNTKIIGVSVSVVLCAAALCAAVCWFFLQNKTGTSDAFSEIKRLENKISQLENVVQSYQKEKTVGLKDLAVLNEKIEDSKASVSSLMGVINRVDMLETDFKKLGKFSTRGALVLTAASLVESAAKKREPFVYEASVLQELSKDTPMEKSAQIISAIASKGLFSKDDLTERFFNLYEINFISQNTQEQENIPQEVSQNQDNSKNWLEKLREKLSTLIIVEKTDKNGKTSQDEKFSDDVCRLIRKGDFETAVLKMNADPKYQTEQFAIWIEDARAEKVFDREMEKIRALTLGNMKTESMKRTF